MDNTSGQGKGSAVPEEIKGLCWGGFFWNWIWGIFNRVWLSFLVFVPVVGFVIVFVLLFKGREWAWQNRPWESVEHFNKIQRRWSIAGLLVLGLAALAGIVLAIVLPMFLGGSPAPMPPVVMKPAAPKPVAPKPAAPKPKPAAPVVAPVPAAMPAHKPEPNVAAAVATDKVEPKGDLPKAGMAEERTAMRAPESAPAPRKATAMLPKPAPRVRVTLPARNSVAPVSAAVADTHVVTPKYNDLMTAVLRPDRAGVVEQLDLGRWVDKPDSTGTTPLQAAVRMRNTEIAGLLLSRGANPNASGARGMSALEIARANGDAAMADLLVRHGAR